MVGQRIGSYRLVRQIGRGGMATVYEAVHERIGRHDAIKVLHPELSRDPEIAARFFNEACAVNVVRHPGIVGISEIGHTPDGGLYIVMEYLEGETLGARLRRTGGRSLPEVQRFGRQIASALAAAHARGIVHRDIKPDNVMIVPDPEAPCGERIKVLDFGIAKLADVPPGGGPARTQAGTLMGTPLYMSPEQCRGASPVDDRSDVYTLGVLLYEMAAGVPPFPVQAAGDLIVMHIDREPPPLRQLNPAAPEDLAALLRAMMAKAPQVRPTMSQVAATLADMGDLLGGTLHGGPAGRLARSTLGHASGQSAALPSRSRAWPALALAAALGVTGWALERKGGPRRDPVRVAVSQASRRVRWQVTSRPAGAQVVRVASGAVLGMTPWTEEQDASAGEVAVVLRHPGYLDLPLAMPLGRDASEDVALVPAPAAATQAPAPPERHKSAPEKRAEKSRNKPPPRKPREIENDEIKLLLH